MKRLSPFFFYFQKISFTVMYTYCASISPSSTVIYNVTNYVTHRILNTSLNHSCAFLHSNFHYESSHIGGF